MIFELFHFIADYFTNLNPKKIIGGIIVLIGLILIGNVISAGDINRAVLYAISGVIVGGVGAVVIYYDMAKDKIGTTYNELDTISNAYKYQEDERKNATAWNMDQGSEEKTIENKKS